MSNQNRFLLPASSSTSLSSQAAAAASSAASASTRLTTSTASDQDDGPNKQQQQHDDQENQHSVDTDFDSYWEEEARNPHRNRIRIGRQYQATVPALLKSGEKDRRKLEELETLSFCPKRSARVSDPELDHYFTVAKSLNLFASLVETRSLLGRDVTIADLNHIRRKEGLSLASVIQPTRQAAISNTTASSASPNPSQQAITGSSTAAAPAAAATTTTTITACSSNTSSSNQATQQSPQKSPTSASSADKQSSSSALVAASSPKEQLTAMNQPLMKALSHFISLHHPCHHDANCKKLQKDVPFEDDSRSAVSITAGNLRQGSSAVSSSNAKESKPGRSRSSLKQAQLAAASGSRDDHDKDQDEHQSSGGDSVQSPSIEDWTREEVEMFSKAIEVCGKNFSSIKKEFLPSKSVKSIVEYYYIGSRDLSDSKKKSNQALDAGDGCSSPEKPVANNNNGQGGGGGSSATGKGETNPSIIGSSGSANSTTSSRNSANTYSSNSSKNPSDISEEANRVSAKNEVEIKQELNLKSAKTSSAKANGAPNSGSKNIDARMSVYNFDDEFKDDSPVQLECPKPGTEVKPLKAKPIIPNTSTDSDGNNSNVGSLKFFMDGQLVLKLNACQDQQKGAEKCHWVQSGERHVNANRQKRYTKRGEKNPDANQNGSQSNSVVSSFQDDDSKNDDLTGDEDSKESMNSFTNSAHARPNNQPSPNSKRLKVVNDPNLSQGQLPSPVDYNRLALNNRMKERSDPINPNSAISQAMPWLQANSFAMAAALLGGLPFPPATANMIQESQNNNNTLNSKPMDLSVEHHNNTPKPPPKSSSRSRNRSKNN